jgi:hypothetical protein
MGRVYHLREARKEEMKEMREYPDDAHLMDIYSFPEYQVEVEVATNVDGPSKPVILDEAIKDVVDPVILGTQGSPSTRSLWKRSSSPWMNGSTWKIWA